MDLESQLRLLRDAAVVKDFLHQSGGDLHRRPEDPDGLYWAEVHPAVASASAFIARIEWATYPDRAPSLRFTSQVGDDQREPKAWPAATGYRAPNDVCKPFTAEGQVLHGEWGHGPNAWRAEGNPFLFVVQNIQDDIDRVAGRRAA